MTSGAEFLDPYTANMLLLLQKSPSGQPLFILYHILLLQKSIISGIERTNTIYCGQKF